VVVGEVGADHGPGALAVEALAEIEIGSVETALAGDALVAGPAEVVGGPIGRVGEAVDLLPGPATDLADPDLIGAGAEGEPERVALAEGDDPARVGVGAAIERVAGQARARVGVDTEDGAVEAGRVARSSDILAAERPTLGGRRGQRGADSARGVSAWIERVALLAVVGEAPGGTVATTHVERAVGTEGEVTDRVARVLDAPVRDQVRFGRHGAAADRQPREAPARDAAVAERTGRSRAWVAQDAGRPPFRGVPAQLGVACEEGVEIGPPRREPWIDRQPEQAAVPVVVDLVTEVRHGGRRRVVEAVERLDQPALLGDEDRAVRREHHVGRVGQPAEDDLLLEAPRERRGRLGRLRPGQYCDPREEQCEPVPPHDTERVRMSQS
jgi:hypothetical protein